MLAAGSLPDPVVVIVAELVITFNQLLLSQLEAVSLYPISK